MHTRIRRKTKAKNLMNAQTYIWILIKINDAWVVHLHDIFLPTKFQDDKILWLKRKYDENKRIEFVLHERHLKKNGIKGCWCDRVGTGRLIYIGFNVISKRRLWKY